MISDPKTGKSYQSVVSKTANSLIGRKIGDVVDGVFVGLPGYKLEISGGTDKVGFPMLRTLAGMKRKRILLTGPPAFRPKKDGLRRKKYVHGNTISPNIRQINMKIVGYGPKSLEEALKEGEV